MPALKYFTDEELKCKCGRPECDAVPVDPAAAIELDLLRGAFNEPMTVTSGVRCPFWNEHEGGEDDSQHLLGKAFDIHAPDGIFMIRLVRLAIDRGWSVGVKRRMVHLDRRPAPPVMFGYLD